MSEWNAGIIDEFRANDGKVGGMFEGAPLLLLHHTGAKTGTERVAPLMYKDLGDSYAVFASKAGADDNPDWFYNVKANPETKIEIGTETVDVVVTEVTGDEHDAIWEPWKRERPQFAEYEQKTARDTIPVLLLRAR